VFGTRWTEKIAEVIVQLKAIYPSGDSDRYRSLHIEKDQNRLHPSDWIVVLK
jgi:hypothetical protein